MPDPTPLFVFPNETFDDGKSSPFGWIVVPAGGAPPAPSVTTGPFFSSHGYWQPEV